MSDVRVGDKVLICTSDLSIKYGFEGVIHAGLVLAKTTTNNALKVRFQRQKRRLWRTTTQTVDLWIMHDGFFGKVEEYIDDATFLRENNISTIHEI